ncbi:uncharacterized protein LOC104584890 isoform X2 [Brachypodium distachyon]|uniref:uncharacterized protein LOC104584890 isoform X2 n=1 Tax=Brachypodium distachyon TaxID=15368 RepID=UPI000D0DF16D|nr:uncharacterized protein LOC104584890 isoform X2 [Brachypodium distachyon]|eukprot:XP_024310615.1 uncharacterized protein LOC104584890 isoform X2 [Brachypodium distachyon]
MLWQKLQREMPATLSEMTRIADMYTLGDPTHPSLMPAELQREQPIYNSAGAFRRNDHQDHRNKRRDDRPDYRYGPAHVAALQDQLDAGSSQCQKTGNQQWVKKGEQKKPWQDKPNYTFEVMLDQPCRFHTTNPNKPVNHTTRQCSWMQRAEKGEASRLPPPPPLTGANAQIQGPPQANNAVNQVEDQEIPGYAGRNEYNEHHQSYMIFITAPTDKQSQRRHEMEVNAVMPAVPKFLYWSEQEINWNQADHPKVMPNPGGYALVVDPTLIGPDINVKFTRVLIDNGSSINILYWDAMLKFGITDNMLEPSRTTFHGIVPGVSCAPVGKIRVDVLFGTRENCRTKNFLFEVVDLNSPYHALLGRPALAKFMATTHIGYLKMKMPGPNGTRTITGNLKRSIECAAAGSALAESLVIAGEKKKLQEAIAMAQAAQIDLPAMTNPHGSVAFQAAEETKNSD